jgi:hypothetical protein
MIKPALNHLDPRPRQRDLFADAHLTKNSETSLSATGAGPHFQAGRFMGKMTTNCGNPRKLTHFLTQLHIRHF